MPTTSCFYSVEFTGLPAAGLAPSLDVGTNKQGSAEFHPTPSANRDERGWLPPLDKVHNESAPSAILGRLCLGVHSDASSMSGINLSPASGLSRLAGWPKHDQASSDVRTQALCMDHKPGGKNTSSMMLAPLLNQSFLFSPAKPASRKPIVIISENADGKPAVVYENCLVLRQQHSAASLHDSATVMPSQRASATEFTPARWDRFVDPQTGLYDERKASRELNRLLSGSWVKRFKRVVGSLCNPGHPANAGGSGSFSRSADAYPGVKYAEEADTRTRLVTEL